MSKPTNCEVCNVAPSQREWNPGGHGGSPPLLDIKCSNESCDLKVCGEVYDAVEKWNVMQASIREAKREAWDEGFSEGYGEGQGQLTDPNPYAKEATDE